MHSLSLHLISRVAGVALLSFVISACSKEPPGCADEATLALTKAAFWRSVDSRLNIDKGEANASARKLFGISIESPRIHEKRADANQIVCVAELKATVIADVGFPVAIKEKELKVQYSSQHTADGKQHIVELNNHELLVAFVYLSTLEFLSLEAEKAQSKSKGDSTTNAEKTPSIQSESNLVQIALTEYQAADQVLNQTYQSNRSKLSDAQQTVLRDEQRAWIQQRDNACSAEAIIAASNGMITGGSALELERLGCMTKQTETRTRELASK
jgi:uncharacterized protein YecT (DUF1311 family)